MKRVTTKAVYDIETMELLSWEGYWVDEQVVCFEQLKKGRETAQKETQLQMQQQQQQSAQQKAEQQAADQIIAQDTAAGKPGTLSPAAAAQFASDTDNINRAYNGMRRTAFAGMGARGFGSAPSGFARTAENGIDLGQQQAQTGAFRNAQVNTQALNDRALAAREGLSGQNLAGESAAANTTLTGAVDQSHMGSTLGDIGQGIGLAASLVNPVAGAVTGIGKAFGKLGTYGSTPPVWGGS